MEDINDELLRACEIEEALLKGAVFPSSAPQGVPPTTYAASPQLTYQNAPMPPTTVQQPQGTMQMPYFGTIAQVRGIPTWLTRDLVYRIPKVACMLLGKACTSSSDTHINVLCCTPRPPPSPITYARVPSPIPRTPPEHTQIQIQTQTHKHAHTHTHTHARALETPPCNTPPSLLSFTYTRNLSPPPSSFVAQPGSAHPHPPDIRLSALRPR